MTQKETFVLLFCICYNFNCFVISSNIPSDHYFCFFIHHIAAKLLIHHTDNPVEVLNEHQSLLVGRYVPTKVISVSNKEKPWFDDQCRHAFGLK